jgi:glycosyltransferase involved in cell wall biosynthesis
MKFADATYAAERELLDRSSEVTRPRILYIDTDRLLVAGERSALAVGLGGEGWRISEPDSPARPVGWLDSIRRIVRLIPQHDIIHLRCGAGRHIARTALPLLVMARFFGKRTLVQFASADIEALLQRYRKYVMPVLRLADGIVVGSRFLQKVLTRYGLSPTLLTEPLDLESWQHQTVTKVQPRILVDCPLEPEYDVACAVRAFRLVKQKYPRAELVIAGSGPQRPTLAATADHDRLYGVEFVGAEGRHSDLYRSCDVYLNSSLLDESPASMVRAFALGLPVVSTDADGLLHMVRDGVSALVSPVGDHVGLADSIIELIENPELVRKLSEQGLTEARKYGWSRVRQDWVNMYRSLEK